MGHVREIASLGDCGRNSAASAHSRFAWIDFDSWAAIGQERANKCMNFWKHGQSSIQRVLLLTSFLGTSFGKTDKSISRVGRNSERILTLASEFGKRDLASETIVFI